MTTTALSALRFPLTLGFYLLSSVLLGQEQSSPEVPGVATSVASRYLESLDKSFSFPSVNGREDFVFIGHSRDRSRGWRVIVLAGAKQPVVAWDSFTLNDAYLDVTGISSINAEAEGSNGYIVALRGCAPHQCADGRIGFAVYASSSRRVYRSHVSTKDDGSYEVTFYPRSYMPEGYKNELVRMMCSDIGISRPSALPIKCSAK